MQRIAFIMHIRPGTEEEYRRRHQSVWPEMLAALTAAGCHNYSIYADGLTLFAMMEVDDFPRYLAAMSASTVNERWQAYMSDILIAENDPATGFPAILQEVFHLD